MSKVLDDSLQFKLVTHVQDRESIADSDDRMVDDDDSGEETQCDADDRRHAKNKWTLLETADLVDGCYEHGVGNWKKILNDPKYHFNKRTAVDLKDRFRTTYPLEYKRLYPGSKQVRLPKKPCEIQPPPFSRVKRKERRPFTSEEDEMLRKGVNKHGVAWARIVHDSEFKLSHRRSGDLRDRFRNAFPDEYDRLGYQTRTRRKGKKSGSKIMDISRTSSPQKDRELSRISIPSEAAEALVGMSSMHYPGDGQQREKVQQQSQSQSQSPYSVPDSAADVLAVIAANQYGDDSQQKRSALSSSAPHFRSQDLLSSGSSSVMFTAFGMGGAPQTSNGFVPSHLASGNAVGLQQTTFLHDGAGQNDDVARDNDEDDDNDDRMVQDDDDDDEDEDDEDDDNDDEVNNDSNSTSPRKPGISGQMRFHMQQTPIQSHQFIQHGLPTPPTSVPRQSTNAAAISSNMQGRNVEFQPGTQFSSTGKPRMVASTTILTPTPRIMGAKIDQSGEVQYKVKWRSSWQPAHALPVELAPSVTEFVSALRRHGGEETEEEE